MRYWVVEGAEAGLFGAVTLVFGISWSTIVVWLVGIVAGAASLFTLALRDHHGAAAATDGESPAS